MKANMQPLKQNMNIALQPIASSLSCTHKDYWLVFDKGQHWICKFLKKGFGHVFILVRDQYGWLAINPCSYGLEVTHLPFLKEQDAPRYFEKQGDKVMRVSVPAKKRSKVFHGVRFFTCVWLIKYYLGITLKAYTPYGLYKALFKASNNYMQTGIRATLRVR